MARFVIDTHALLWFLADDPRLGSKAKAALTSQQSELWLPAIALAESLWIVDKLQGAISAADVLAAIDADPRITIDPLTREIVQIAHSLTGISEMHDRQIAASAVALANKGDAVTLLTKDSNITASGLVPTDW